VVHDLFEEQTSVDDVVTKIMQKAQTLLQCERCAVMLKDSKESSVYEVSPLPWQQVVQLFCFCRSLALEEFLICTIRTRTQAIYRAGAGMIE
jgi:hypothetical protein